MSCIPLRTLKSHPVHLRFPLVRACDYIWLGDWFFSERRSCERGHLSLFQGSNLLWALEELVYPYIYISWCLQYHVVSFINFIICLKNANILTSDGLALPLNITVFFNFPPTICIHENILFFPQCLWSDA